jgi:predicted ATPase/class 3 adenylate cyclase
LVVEGVPSGTVTFVFSDVEGSTRLWAADPEAMSASLQVHDGLVRATLEGRGGYVFATGGDSFGVAFGRVSDAVAGAVAVQEELAGAVWPGPVLRVRIGLHVGEAEERGGDYFGAAVNVASRVAAAGHGGQIVVTAAVRDLAGVETVDLGLHRLSGIAEPLRLFQVGGGVFPRLRVPANLPATNLPVRPTRLFGRDDEVSTARRLLVSDRLVTVTGAGGAGKTRLAVAVGGDELPLRSGGVWFVDLTTTVTDREVVPAVAATVGLQLSGGDATGQLVGFLADRDALVILDNCEHVLDGCAAFAEVFVARPGRSVLLATSREALGVDGERALTLGPLASGDVWSPAVRLFADRAAATDAHFRVADDEVATVAALCRGLDGLPLAIELAAARVAVMTPAELLASLAERFGLLTGTRRPGRHRTLRATLDWSYQLLDGDEQRVLRALGVFVGGFGLDAVAAVTGLDRLVATDVVQRLVAKSLVEHSRTTERSRFFLLEMVKAYAEDCLVAAGEATDVRDRHLAYFQRAATDGDLVPFADYAVAARLEHEVGNLAAAVQWAAAGGRWSQAAETVHVGLDAFLLAQRADEVRNLLEACVAHLDGDPTLAGYLRSDLVMTAIVRGDMVASHDWAGELTSSPNPCCEALGWAYLGFFSAYDDLERARTLLAEARRAHERCATGAEETTAALVRIAIDAIDTIVAAFDGDDETAARFAEQLDASAAALDRVDLFVVAGVTAGGACLINLGRPADALALSERMSRFREVYRMADFRAVAQLALGQTEPAVKVIREHAVRGHSGRLSGEAGDSVILLAILAEHDGDQPRAIDLLLRAGTGRSVGVRIPARGLARRLGVAEEFAELERHWRHPRNTGEDAQNIATGMNALRDEMTHRGWL